MKTYIFTLRRCTSHDEFESVYRVDCFARTDELTPSKLSSMCSSIRLRMCFNPDMYPHLLSMKLPNSAPDLTPEAIETMMSGLSPEGITSFLERFKISI